MALAVIRMCTFAPVPWVSLFPQCNSKRRSRSGNPGLGIFLFFFSFQFRMKCFLFSVLRQGSSRHSEANYWFIRQFSQCFCSLSVRSPMEKTAGRVATGGEAASQSTCGLGTHKCSQAKTTFPTGFTQMVRNRSLRIWGGNSLMICMIPALRNPDFFFILDSKHAWQTLFTIFKAICYIKTFEKIVWNKASFFFFF